MPIPLPSRRLPLAVLAAFALPFVPAAAPLGAGVPAGPPLMFVTSTTGSGHFGTGGGWAETTAIGGLSGLAAADKICQVRAEAAGLAAAGAPVFRAWVSIPGTDAHCHLQGLGGTRANSCNSAETGLDAGPWYRTDGVPFLDSRAALQSGILGTASRSETGAFVSGIAWTGSNADGTATGSTCSSWGSTTGFGSVGSTTSERFWAELSGDGTFGCGNATAHLYCFQAATAGPPRAAWPEPAALVFLRTGGESGDLDGIAGADLICQQQAATYRLPGADSFRAWLSDAQTDAKDRLTIDGPWYRADGVRVAASLAALIDGNLDSAINRVPQDAPLSAPDRVWTGTFAGGTKSPNHCVEWFTFNADQHGTVGSSDETGNSWTSTADFTDNCNEAGRFYCFGDVVVIFWDRFETGNASRWSARVGFPP